MPRYELLTVDPGVKCLAVAAWDPVGHLADSWCIPRSGTTQFRDTIHKFSDFLIDRKICATSVCSEFPNERGKSSNVRVADLLHLAAVAGMVSTFATREIVFVSPLEWKGNQPKSVTQDKVRKALHKDGTLDTFLKTIADAGPLGHNLYDAVGIGLWWYEKGQMQ